MKTFSTINLGCKVNLYETNAITNQFVKAGFKYVYDLNKANIIIVNTCSVTNKADAKSRNMISKAKHAKMNPIVIAIGCFVQTNKKWFDNGLADIVIGCKDKNKVLDLLNIYLKDKKPINTVVETKEIKNFENFECFKYLDNTRAFLKIQDGCNFYCSYCLIPYCRARQRAMKHDDVISQVKQYVKLGYKEIVLTGVNTAGYLDGKYTFYDLLVDLNKLKGDFRIRISSLEPFQINHKLIDLLASNPKRWANQIHLCLQSANNDILKAMNRKYSIQEFISLVKYIRKKMHNVAITTDYIVAFGNETEKQFENSIKNLKKIKFANMNIFIYSRRNGTVADLKYKNDINPKIARKRYNKLILLKDQWQKAYLKSLLNKKLEVIVEKSQIPLIHGYSSEFVKVVFNNHKEMRNEKVVIKSNKIIKDKFGYCLLGKLN